MAFNPDAEGSFGRITSGIEKQDNLILHTIEFIYSKLPEWRDSLGRSQELSNQSEPKLNPRLAKYLERRARDEFAIALFSHEEPQSGRSSADLSASLMSEMVIRGKLYATDTSFLVIECKRLPAPTKDREREYLTGEKRGGGVQRFKLGLYAVGEDSAVLIGYVQREDILYWHKRIRDWLSELAGNKQADGTDWSRDKCLSKLNCDVSKRSARWLSLHARTGKTSEDAIFLHHLWIEMPPMPSNQIRRRTGKN